MGELRRNPRTSIEVKIEVTMTDGNVELVNTQNLSSSGLFFEISPSKMPTMGDILWVKISGAMADGDQAPLNRVKVIRITDDGVGVKFVDL